MAVELVEGAVRQSLLYFVVTGLCAAAAVVSVLYGRVDAVTVLGILLAAAALWLGLSNRRAGN